VQKLEIVPEWLNQQDSFFKIKLRTHLLAINLNKLLKLIFLQVPSGEFWMGADPNKDRFANKNEIPATKIYLPTYWIGRFPITNQQYQCFTIATGYQQPNHWNSDLSIEEFDNPLTNVNWKDAQAFCNWVSEMTDWKIRLPSEAEWEKAARGTDQRIWPWGNVPATSANCNFGSGGPTPIGNFGLASVSPYGCLDMVGNVWEWTQDLYMPYPYQAFGRKDYENNVGSRVLRGGSWFHNESEARCTSRLKDKIDAVRNFYGFRCALDY
jgi:formylglycine-generating enzyme required for sulfatase activity